MTNVKGASDPRHINEVLAISVVMAIVIASITAGLLGGVGPAIFAGILAGIGGGGVAWLIRKR